MGKTERKAIGTDVQTLWKWHDDCVQYRAELGLNELLPKCVDYVEGKQWANSTPDTEDYPRPVFNILENIVLNKKSKVLPSPIKIAYRAWDSSANVEKFNNFAAYELARLEQDRLNNESLWDSIVKGSHCLYYYWDKDCVGIEGDVEGDISAQVIDVQDVDVADIKERNIQKQTWVMLRSRENVEHIKDIAEKEEDKALICSDDNDSVYNEIEDKDDKYVTVLTRFFRHNGEVYWERATKAVMFMKARPLTPNVKAMTSEGNEENEEAEGNNFTQKVDVVKKYPIVFFNWKKRNKSIYGRGEIETIIKNQDYINRTAGCQILSAAYEAMSGYVVDDDVLEGQEITNEPGQVITNYSRKGGKIAALPRTQMTSASIGTTDKIIDLTRKMAGSTEVMNGEVISAGMSGAAIAQLQQEAATPISDIRDDFMQSMKQVGEILEQFMRFYFTGKKFAVQREKTKTVESFDSEEYKSIRFDVVAEADTGAVMSTSATAALLENLFNAGKITLRTYIDCYPAELISGRQKLIENIQRDEQTEQISAQLQQAMSQLQEQEQTINSANSIITENRTLKEKLIQLQAEYSQKIEAANQILIGMGKRAEQYYSDATEFAGEIAKGRGLIPATAPKQKVTRA